MDGIQIYTMALISLLLVSAIKSEAVKVEDFILSMVPFLPLYLRVFEVI